MALGVSGVGSNIFASLSVGSFEGSCFGFLEVPLQIVRTLHGTLIGGIIGSRILSQGPNHFILINEAIV